jgi:hypothetical protein
MFLSIRMHSEKYAMILSQPPPPPHYHYGLQLYLSYHSPSINRLLSIVEAYLFGTLSEMYDDIGPWT